MFHEVPLTIQDERILVKGELVLSQTSIVSLSEAVRPLIDFSVLTGIKCFVSRFTPSLNEKRGLSSLLRSLLPKRKEKAEILTYMPAFFQYRAPIIDFSIRIIASSAALYDRSSYTTPRRKNKKIRCGTGSLLCCGELIHEMKDQQSLPPRLSFCPTEVA